MTVAEILTAERERQGLSLYAIAKTTGFSYSVVHGIFNGDTPNPGILTLDALLESLGKTHTWLDRERRKPPSDGEQQG